MKAVIDIPDLPDYGYGFLTRADEVSMMRNAKPLDELLDTIKADVEDCIRHSRHFTTTKACCGVRDDVLRVIDKYRGSGDKMKVLIDIDSDIMQKITNQYYGENEVDKTLVNELLMSLMHGISLNVMFENLSKEIKDYYTNNHYMGERYCTDVLQIIDKYR